MKRRVLFLCNTYYQMILALHMIFELYSDASSEIVLTDNSIGADKVVEKINQMGIIDMAYCFHQGNLEGSVRSIHRFIEYVYPATFGRNQELVNLYSDKTYDDLFFYNEGLLAHYTYAILKDKNPNLQVHRFEECMTSYNERYDMHYSPKKFGINIIRKCMHKPLVKNDIQDFYCMYPVLYDGKLPTKVIPPINRGSKVTSVVCQLYDIDDTTYDRKYIFFATTQDVEYKSNEEFELVEKIAEIIGKDNILIKKHPRDTRTVYEDSGYVVVEYSSVPWEAIMCQHDFSSHVFITTMSGSVLSINLSKGMGVRTYLLYPMISYPIANRIESLERFLAEYPEKKEYITILSKDDQIGQMV